MAAMLGNDRCLNRRTVCSFVCSCRSSALTWRTKRACRCRVVIRTPRGLLCCGLIRWGHRNYRVLVECARQQALAAGAPFRGCWGASAPRRVPAWHNHIEAPIGGESLVYDFAHLLHENVVEPIGAFAVIRTVGQPPHFQGGTIVTHLAARRSAKTTYAPPRQSKQAALFINKNTEHVLEQSNHLGSENQTENAVGQREIGRSRDRCKTVVVVCHQRASLGIVAQTSCCFGIPA
jgi:hypothetical protein